MRIAPLWWCTGALCIAGTLTGCSTSRTLPTQPIALETTNELRSSGWLSNGEYQFRAINPFRSQLTEAVGINGDRRIVGTYASPTDVVDGRENGYLYHDGDFVKIRPPNAFSTGAYGINRHGVIVGYFAKRTRTGERGPDRGFVLKHGSFSTPFDRLRGAPEPSTYTGVAFTSVNDDGDMTGTVDLGEEDFRGFYVRDERLRWIDKETWCRPHGINNRGHVVGEYNFDNGFLLRNGNLTVFDYPGAEETVARAISDDGVIVGSYAVVVDGADHGFVRDRNGSFRTVDFPDAKETILSGINEDGELVGTYIDAAGNALGFRARPLGGDRAIAGLTNR